MRFPLMLIYSRYNIYDDSPGGLQQQQQQQQQQQHSR